METNGKLSELQKLQADAARTLSQPEFASSLLWEMCYNVTEFQVPVTLGNYHSNDSMNLRDIMLAKVETLGHCDKYPRAYDWQQLLQTLGSGEELLWIVTKQSHEKKFTIYVALKFNHEDIGSLDQVKTRKEQFQVFSDNFSRCRFPESIMERIPEGQATQNLLRQLRRSGKCFAVVGMPSLKEQDPEKVLAERNEEKRPFGSLNDILEPYINVDSAFTVVFSISPCTSSDIGTAFREKFQLRNLLKPFLDQEINHTEGRSWGTGISITPEHDTVNVSTTPKMNIFGALWRGITGSCDTDRDALKQYAAMGGTYEPWGTIRDASEVTTSVTITPKQESSSKHNDSNTSDSQTIHVTNSDLVFIDSILEQSVKHLQQSIGGNGFYASAVVYSDNENIGKGLAKTIRATLSGSQNYLRPMQIIPFRNEGFFQLDHNVPMAEILQDSGIKLEVLNSERASISVPLPDADIPGGMNTKKSVFYSKPEEVAKHREEEEGEEEEEARRNKSSDNGVLLGRVAYYENQLGYRSEEEYQFVIKHGDMFSHTFITGAPGGGKSQRTTFILNHLPADMRLIVLETAKREYGDTLHRDGKKLLRYTMGNSQKFPLRINPFFFDPGTSLKQHISVVADALTDLLPVEALVGPKMRKAVENSYLRCGWDIEASEYCGKTLYPVYPDMLMFNSEIQRICRTFAEYGAEVRGNYTGALKNRASIFLDEIYQDIFSFDGNKTIDQLFPTDVDTVIEMEDMPPSEMNMPAFILTLLIHRLRAYRFLQKEQEKLHRSEQQSPGFIIAIEEAHNVLAREIEVGANNEQQTGKGKALLSLIKKTLAEGRGIEMGLIIIDQSAHAIAPSVISNTNMKIIFRQKDGEEVDVIGKSIGLSEEDRQDLQFLGVGECVISTVNKPKPFKLAKLPKQPKVRNGGDRLVSLPERLRCPPYYWGRKFLDSWRAGGIYSQNSAIANADIFYKHCKSNYAVARYVLGKYLLDMSIDNPRFYHLLDLYLDENSRDWKTRMNYIARILMMIMDGGENDLLLSFLIHDINVKDFCRLPMGKKLKAARAVKRMLEEDMKDRSRLKELNELFDKFADAAGNVEKVEIWRKEFFACLGDDIYFEHLKYKNADRPSVTSTRMQITSRI